MALYENGKRISGIRDFPAYTWAEYQALPAAQRPKVWKCTDRDYTEIPFAEVGSATGTTEIALPDGWQEIVADVEPNNQRSDSFSFTVTKAQLRNGSKTFKQSFYMSSSYYFLVQITVTASTIKMYQVNISGTDKISASTLRVYSR